MRPVAAALKWLVDVVANAAKALIDAKVKFQRGRGPWDGRP